MRSGAVVGAYRLVEKIGSGGMGVVWSAVHVQLGRRAAIKMLQAQHSVNPTIVRRFFNEARAATAITDPGIVQIFDFGQHTDGAAYIVMELLDGESLRSRLTRVRRLELADALRIVRQVASTLGAAHALGIIHRDLKPENIFLVRDPEVTSGERAKILDFGIAKLVDDTSGNTSVSHVLGTPAYMSPEQCRNAVEVDQRSDVYSLGCVLYALLVGEPPFTGDGGGDVLVKHVTSPAPLASMRVPAIPPDVDQLIATCLAKDPAKRHASGAALATAIGGLAATPVSVPASESTTAPDRPAARWLTPTVNLDGAPATPAPVPPVPEPAPATTESRTTLSGATGQTPVVAPRSRSRVPVVAALGAAAIAGVVLAIVLTPRGSTEPAAEPTPAPVRAERKPEPVPKPTLPPVEPAPPPAPTPAETTAHRIATVLAAFAEWAPAHADAACPTIDKLATPADQVDGWDHAMALTCTDQPGDQIAGVRSAGPDGRLGTGDDVTSWSLGRDVTAVVAGARWHPASKPVAKPAHAPPKPHPDVFEVDDNGIPISRHPGSK